MCNFRKLWNKCSELGLSRSELFRDLNMSTQTLNAMRHNENVSLKTIDKLCTYFKCQPDELMEIM